MKNVRITFLLLLVTILIQACKKDDEDLTNMIYGTWRTDTHFYDNIIGGRDLSTFVFVMPNSCKYKLDDDDGAYLIVKDSLTFSVIDKKLYLYNQDGSVFSVDTIQRISRSTLVLQSGNTEKLKRERY